jgi:hypothetical protein
MKPDPGSPGNRKRIPRPVLFLGLWLVSLLIGTSAGVLLATLYPNSKNGPISFSPAPGATTTSTPGAATSQTPAGTVFHLSPIPGQVNTPAPGTPGGMQNTGSPTSLLFGTNMSLFDSTDQVLNSAATRTLLGQIHPGIIRMPTRTTLSQATMVQAAQIIKSLGATPLIILQGRDITPNALAYDTNIINAMNTIFGKSLVYYEYGNEEDLLGIPATNYTASWNSLIPQLKSVALNGQFIGPVNYQYDHNYLQYFLQNAQPRPDAISWHEYTCDDALSGSVCIANIDNWTSHITDARAVMQATIGSSLPIMITEWNYTPKVIPNDGKVTNSAFMTAWTTKALQTLAANHVFAAMQYSCTNTPFDLINSNSTLTAQGAAFQAQYQQMLAGG